MKGKFVAHFLVKRNIIFERAKFNLRSHQDGESVDNFITHLYCLAEYCEFGTLRDDLIRDRIVVGIKDMKLSKQLQLDSKLTLEKAIKKSGSQRQLKSSKRSYRKQNLTHHQLMLTVCPMEREKF